MPTLGEGYIRSFSKIGYDRRYEDFIFPSGTRCIEMVDYVGTGVSGVVDSGAWYPTAFDTLFAKRVSGVGDAPGNYFGVYYCRAESFYRTFANASFGGPCIVEIGEFPAEAYDSDYEPITDKRINMAACFRDSDIEILPHGCSRGIIDNTNSLFENCKKLRNWSPTEMVDAGLAGVKDPSAPRILRSNGIAESAFLLHLAPQTMRRMFAGCENYAGRNINSISWRNLKNERAAEDFAAGCRFEPHYLAGVIDWLHREFFVLKRVRTPLLRVNLGSGVVTGGTAARARQLIAAGIELQGFEIKD